MKTTDDRNEIKYKLNGEITPLLRKLGTEMESARRKWSANGIITPLVLLTGSLSLYSSGIGLSQIASTLLGSGGLIRSCTSWNDLISDKNKAALNPVYFLWKAHQS